MKKGLLQIILLFFITNLNAQIIVINEFMAKNTNVVQDIDGDYNDWIELYNSSNSVINLNNYSLSDDADELNKWVFPEVHILPHSYLLIFASDKNRLDTSELHTNFKISSSGEALYLSNNLGTVIDQTNAINLSDNESYCRIPDGATDWIITDNSSPNASNIYSNQLIFSKQEGFYTSEFFLSINSLLGDHIYYTLNGDIPTEESNILLSSLLIEERHSEPNVFCEIPSSAEQELISYKAWESPQGNIDKATILRCASYRNGVRTSDIYTKTFFVDPDINEKYTLPIISLITETGNLFSNDSGIYVPGIHFNINNPEWTGNFFMKGDDWEKKIHIEYFDANGNLGFSQDAGVRIHGGKTRQAAQKTLRLYARKEYGEKYFNYKLFPNRQINQYKRFILRTTMGSWGDQTIIKDALAQNISSGLNINYQDFQPVILFINGEYWGIHTIRDRIDEKYIEYTHNIDKDSVEFKEYGNIDYTNLMTYIENNSLELDVNYNYVKTKIDISNYIDYTIAELFFKNYDWPANNMKLWRKIPDGKWRWVLYDLDAGFGNENYNMLIHATKNDSTITWPNSPSSTFLFRNLLLNNEFKNEFINRYAEILNNDFDSNLMSDKLNNIKKIYSPEIEKHINRWHYPDSYSVWEEDIDNRLLSFIEKRPCAVRGHIMTFFELTSFDFECHTHAEINKSENLMLAPNPNNGKFFLYNKQNDIVGATISITNINGQVVYKEHNVHIQKNKRKYFDFSDFSDNVYVLQIISDSYSEQKKLIISN